MVLKSVLDDAKKKRPLCIFFQKWVHIEETLIKLNISPVRLKFMSSQKSILKFRKKLETVPKENLIVNVLTVKNI